MVYTPSSPNPNDTVSSTQPIIRSNFVDLDSYTKQDHEPLNGVSAGKHKWSRYVVNSTPGGPITGSGEGVVYTKQSTTNSGRIDCYYKYQTDGATTFSGMEFPLNLIKAFGASDTSGLVADTSFNVNTVSYNASTWTITLSNNISDNISKIMVVATGLNTTSNFGGPISYQVLSTNQIRIKSDSPWVSTISFMVMAIG